MQHRDQHHLNEAQRKASEDINVIRNELRDIRINDITHMQKKLVRLETNQWWLMGIGLATLSCLFTAVISNLFFL
jgi:hypothetical protein